MIVANPSSKLLSNLVPQLSDRCQGYGHIFANCPSEMKITFVNGVPTQAPKSDDEEVTYQLDINEDDDSDYDQEGSDAECNYIQLARSNYTSAI